MGVEMIIECRDIIKKYDELIVINKMNLSVKKGEFVVILGPSGCGKSTFLFMLAGFERPSKGKIYIHGKEVKKPGRDRGFVFQEYALFPWRTVLGNVMSGIKEKKHRREIAMEFIERVGLTEFANVYPHKLSGGMKQRVSIARALAYNPEILLMDEPFGALDAQTRKLMQQELLKLLRELNKTIVFVTHSVIEAVYLADRVIVMSKRPAKIIYESEIIFKGDRSYTSSKYLEYRKEILHYLNYETGVKE